MMLKNVSSNWAVMLLAILATYILLPFSLKMLGREQYGVWLLVTSMTGYLSLLLLGVPMASVRYITKYLSLKDYDNLNKAIGSCAGLYLTLGGVAFSIGVVLLFVFNHVYKLPPQYVGPANVAFWLVLLYLAGGFFGQLPIGILQSHHDFVIRNIIQSVIWIMRVVLTIVFLYWKRSLVYLAVVQLATMLLEAAISWTVIHRRYPHVKLSLSGYQWTTVKQIFSFSMFVLILNLGSQLSFETDSLVIGKFLTVDQIPFYSVANSICLYLIQLVIGIGAVLMPMATKMESLGEHEKLNDLFLKWSKIAFSITLAAAAYLMVFGGRFISWWVGPSFEQPSGEVLWILMLSNLLFLPVRGVCLPILMGIGKPGRATIAFLAAGVLNLGMSIALAKPLGLAGVAWGTAIPSMGFAVAVWVFTCQELKIGMGRYLKYVVPRAAFGAAAVIAVLAWWKTTFDIHGFLKLGVSGVLMLVLFGLVWVAFVYWKDPYVDLYDRFRGALPMTLARGAGR